MRYFKNLEQEPRDAILGLNQSFAADLRSVKVNLGAGVYKTEDLKPYILKTVKKAEARLIENENSKDYLPIDGSPEFVRLTKGLVFGVDAPLDHIYGAQATGGTGALRIGGAFLKQAGLETIYISEPTWDNHQRIFNHAGLTVRTYPYYNSQTNGFDCAQMVDAIDKMDKGSVLLLQACCHNPSGCDPTLPEWGLLFKKMQEREIFPFFDFAYQGFGEGLDRDAQALRAFMKLGMECLVAASYAKNFGLYAERCGVLFAACQDPEEVERVGSKIRVIIRGLYSNPPCHGARIVAEILGDQKLREEWEAELAGMRGRISEMRSALARGLKKDFLSKQKGMFSYTGLSAVEVEQLIASYGIYMPRDGRINVAGLNADNLSYVIDAILKIRPMTYTT